MKDSSLSRKYMSVWRWISRRMRRIMEMLPIRAIRKMRTMKTERKRPVLDDGKNPNEMKSVDV